MRHVRTAGRWRWPIWFGVLLLSGCTSVGGCDVDIDHPRVTLPPVSIHAPKGVPVPTTRRVPPTAVTTTTRVTPTTASRSVSASAPSTAATASPSLSAHPAGSRRAAHRGERSLRWRGPSLGDPFAHFFAGFESGTHAWVAALGAALLVILVTTVGVALATTLTLALLPVILIEALSAAILAGFFGLAGIALALLFGFLAILLKEMLFLAALLVLAALAGPLGWVALAPALAVAGIGGARRTKRPPRRGPPQTSA